MTQNNSASLFASFIDEASDSHALTGSRQLPLVPLAQPSSGATSLATVFALQSVIRRGLKTSHNHITAFRHFPHKYYLIINAVKLIWSQCVSV